MVWLNDLDTLGMEGYSEMDFFAIGYLHEELSLLLCMSPWMISIWRVRLYIISPILKSLWLHGRQVLARLSRSVSQVPMSLV